MSTPYFGECPLCRQGVLLAVVRLSDERVIAECDDCASQFASPDNRVKSPEETPANVEVREASHTEAEATGWPVQGYI